MTVRGIRRDVQKATRDNRVSEAEAKAIVRGARDGGRVNRNEARELKKQYDRTKDKMDAGARRVFQQALGLPADPKPAPVPRLTTPLEMRLEGVVHEMRSELLFVTGIKRREDIPGVERALRDVGYELAPEVTAEGRRINRGGGLTVRYVGTGAPPKDLTAVRRALPADIFAVPSYRPKGETSELQTWFPGLAEVMVRTDSLTPQVTAFLQRVGAKRHGEVLSDFVIYVVDPSKGDASSVRAALLRDVLNGAAAADDKVTVSSRGYISPF